MHEISSILLPQTIDTSRGALLKFSKLLHRGTTHIISPLHSITNNSSKSSIPNFNGDDYLSLSGSTSKVERYSSSKSNKKHHS